MEKRIEETIRKTFLRAYINLMLNSYLRKPSTGSYNFCFTPCIQNIMFEDT